MNEIIKNIKERRSVRAFMDKPVPKEVIETLIDCARHAPSAMNAQPWKFIVIQNRELIKEASERVKKNAMFYLRIWPLTGVISPSFWKKEFRKHVKPYMESKNDVIFYNAQCVVLITAKETMNSKLDCSCAAQNIMLAAHSLGIGSCWIGFARFLERDNEMMKKLGVEKGKKIVAAIVLGYPKIKPKAPERKTDNLLFIH